MVGVTSPSLLVRLNFYVDTQGLRPELPAVQAGVPDLVSALQRCAVPRTEPFPRNPVRCRAKMPHERSCNRHFD